jgi:hypothetical protein
MQRSLLLRAATLAFALVCAVAVHTVTMPRAGAAAAAWFGAATFATLALIWGARERRQPAALEIAPDGITAFDLAGNAVLRGRIAGCVQWTQYLMIVAVAPHERGRTMSLVIAADALSGEAFRELAVRARHAAR